MAENSTNMSSNLISLKDLTNHVDLIIEGFGDYIIGLSASGSIIIEENDFSMCMSLLLLTVQENGGCTLSSVNKDLPCYINNATDPMSGEVHLLDGSTIEIADKKLKFFNGPIPKRRRKLPQTPGTMLGEPPTKPGRNCVQNESSLVSPNTHSEILNVNVDAREHTDDVIYEDDAGEEADKRWLEASWCLLDLPESDQYMFKELYTPEQISILAASYFTKQLRMFTDARITQVFLDDIFRLFMDTINYCRDAYMEYLADISRALAKTPDKPNIRPMHGPAVKFLTELLKQCLDPVDRVVLILDLLRTFSHFDNNVGTMIRWQTAAAVLGSMSAYVQILEVQQYSMDILAKLATFRPTIEKKAPVREVAVDMIVRAVECHSSDVQLARSSCRVLANLSSTLIAVLNRTLESVIPTSDHDHVSDFINKYEDLLNYMFKDGIQLVQNMMKRFDSDIGVNTEGRRFIFYYVKLPQMQFKKNMWIAEATHEVEVDKDTPKSTLIGDSGEGSIRTELENTEFDRPVHTQSKNAQADSDPVDNNEPKSKISSDNEDLDFTRNNKNEFSKAFGILKKVGSYENLRTPERRLGFSEETVGGSDSDTDTSTSVSDAECDGSLVYIHPKQRSDVENFNSNVVKHFVMKTIKRRYTHGNYQDDSESDPEHEFLTSLDKIPPSEYDGALKNNSEVVRNVNESARKYDYNDLEKSAQHSVISKDSSGDEDDNTTTLPENQNKVEAENDNFQSVYVDEKNAEVEKTKTKHGAASDTKHSITDVVYLGKLVRSQIITYVGSLVFQGEDSMVLMVIDKSIKDLLEDAKAPLGLIEYAGNQYGSDLTLMDLEPAMVISVIDAVRYRSVTTELVQSAVLSLTRSMCATLQRETISITMLFFKYIFSDQSLRTIITEQTFLEEFRSCFQNATERMENSHSIEEIRKNLSPHSFVV